MQDAAGQVSLVTDMQFNGNSLVAQVDAERLSATVSRHQHGDQQVGPLTGRPQRAESTGLLSGMTGHAQAAVRLVA